MDASVLECLPVFSRVSASDAAKGVDLDELTKAKDDLVDLKGQFSSGGQNYGLALGDLGSMSCRSPMEKVAVLPVPD